MVHPVTVPWSYEYVEEERECVKRCEGVREKSVRRREKSVRVEEGM